MSMKLHTRLFCILILAGSMYTLLPPKSFAKPQQQTIIPSSAAEELKSFLRGYRKTPGSSEDKTTRYFATFVDLKDDGKDEVIVYLTGPKWCGSGGCTTLVLAQQGSSYTVVAKVTLSRPPIRVLTNMTNGWHSLGVGVRGGGIEDGYEAILNFTGKTYPSNPTVPPVERSSRPDGKIVIPEELKGMQTLYP